MKLEGKSMSEYLNNRDLHGYHDIKVCDTHIHIAYQHPVEKTMETLKSIMEHFCYDKIVIQAMSESSNKGTDPASSIKALYLKHCMQPNVYAFGSLYHHHDERDTSDGYLSQVKSMWSMGFDGMKMLDGKPGMRKKLGRPLDDPIFDEYYEYMEENTIPLKMHVGDPSYFWDINKVSKHALDSGWFCDESFPTMEQLYNEVNGILTKFPKLCLNLAHFYFVEDNLEWADSFLDRWENVSFDLTPNASMFAWFTRRYAKWREFFIKHQRKIFFGTDTYNIPCTAENIEKVHGHRINLVRTYLEKNEPFEYSHFDEKAGFDKILKPFGLEREVLQNIYCDNCMRLVGKKPREINYDLAADETRWLLDLYQHEEVCDVNEENRLLRIENLKIMEEGFGLHK
jgi:predicted TIM-barrel fold metal-dependent hydrolase